MTEFEASFKEMFGIRWPRLLESLGQTVYMLGWALLIGAVIGLGLALLLVLCRRGGLLQNRIVYTVVNVYVNIVRSMPFIITLVFVFPLTRLIVGKTYGSMAMLVPLVIYISPYMARAGHDHRHRGPAGGYRHGGVCGRRRCRRPGADLRLPAV